jgi:hypothetical protein
VSGDEVDKFYDDISMLFHSLSFVILCGTKFSSLLQNGALCFFENFLLYPEMVTGLEKCRDIRYNHGTTTNYCHTIVDLFIHHYLNKTGKKREFVNRDI